MMKLRFCYFNQSAGNDSVTATYHKKVGIKQVINYIIYANIFLPC